MCLDLREQPHGWATRTRAVSSKRERFVAASEWSASADDRSASFEDAASAPEVVLDSADPEAL